MDALESAWTDIKGKLDTACLQSARDARLQLLSGFNSLTRRFRQYETEAEWAALVLEGSRPFANQLALFALENGELYLRGQVNLAISGELSFPIEEAAAFQSAHNTKDPVTALRTPAEVTEALSTDVAMERAHLLPIVNGTRVAAILFAAGSEDADLDGLEFVAGLASTVLNRQSNTARHTQIAIFPQLPARSLPAEGPGMLLLATLDQEERQLHIRARRFSRVAVAELQLARPEACRAGREHSNLYAFLAKEIDRSREIYRTQFMTIPSMADYLHMELVNTAAEGDESKLGVDYPGQLL
jgi:hypothetical protein